MEHLFNLAKKVAISGYLERDFYLGAVGIRADGKIVSARNRTSKIPDVHGHAEARLIRKLGNKPAKLVIVVRYCKGSSGFGMAKPCKNCEKVLKKAGVKKVIYTNLQGEYSTLN